MTDFDPTWLDAQLDRLGRDAPATIPLLQAVQDRYRYLPAEAIDYLAEHSEIRAATIKQVSRFFRQFRHRPAGENRICVCVGTACHVKGADRVYEAFRRTLGIEGDDDTDAERRFTVDRVACLGCCTLAPVVQIGRDVYGHITPQHVADVLDDFSSGQKSSAQPGRRRLPEVTPAGEVRLGLGSCCQARGSDKVYQAVADEVARSARPVRIKTVGCVGICSQTPLLEVVRPNGSTETWTQVDPDSARQILRREFPRPGVLGRAVDAVRDRIETLLTDEPVAAIERHSRDVREETIATFLAPQEHIVTEHSGLQDPTGLAEYRSRGGFDALQQVIAQADRAATIGTIARAGLRGRGGAGYPTARKWQGVAEAPGPVKYAICNGDEGDPGAFMDRMLLESHPYRVLEGLAIAAWCVGAAEAWLYIRWEYPLAVERVRRAIEQCVSARLLGEEAFGGKAPLRVRIFEGAGRFVCGEETALLQSMMGKAGFPQKRPPYPAQAGLHGRPTLVNNVETLANVPWILRQGPEAFAALGTSRSPGTKVFALAGKVAGGGLIEVPMGISIRRIVEDIGGGCPGGKAFKAVQIGGPSGGCIPARLGDTPVDYEALGEVGAMMGSGGLVVLDEDDCMVDIARYFLRFTHEESCGKCRSCRQGSGEMLELLDRLTTGLGQAGDIDRLEELCEEIPAGSLCGLGKTAANPVRTSLRYFREEFQAHLAGRCPARVCPSLIRYRITDDCIGCTKCAQQCPVEAIGFAPFERHKIDDELCVRCGACRSTCPAEAVVIDTGREQ